MTNDEYRNRALKALLSAAEEAGKPETRVAAAQALLWAIREEEAAPAAEANDEAVFEPVRCFVQDGRMGGQHLVIHRNVIRSGQTEKQFLTRDGEWTGPASHDQIIHPIQWGPL